MAIESKNLFVWVKSMARGQSLPIDSTEVQDSLSSAENYAKSATAYGGQTIKVLVDGKYKMYTLQPSDAGYMLEEVGNTSNLKQYVIVAPTLPETGQEEGILYINSTDATGSIWTGSDWKEVFRDVQSVIEDIKTDLGTKAPLTNPNFIGGAKIDGNEIALKSYVDGLISNLTSSAPGVVDGETPLPTTGYKAGQTWRVAAAGTYSGHVCEVGDLIICLKDHSETAGNDDFMVVQANIDGAVTSAAETSTIGEIVVFNAVTGKIIKGSGINISSLNDVIAKAHEHTNKAKLDTYDKTQTELLTAAKSEAQGLVDTLQTTVNAALDAKANKVDVDASLKTITDNLNTKVDSITVNNIVEASKTETLSEAATAASEAFEARIGGIPNETTLKAYIDTSIGSGGTASAEAIATAKQEAIDIAKAYVDDALTVTEF